MLYLQFERERSFTDLLRFAGEDSEADTPFLYVRN